MKYIFLEKHGSNSDPLYKEYLYFITDDKNFDYSTLSDNQKKLIHFKICVPESDCSNILNSFNHNSPKNYESAFGNIYSYIFGNNLFEQSFFKFTIDDNNKVIKAE